MNLSIPMEAEGAVPSSPRPLAASPATILIVSENEQCHLTVRQLQTRTNWTLSSRFSFADAVTLIENQEFAVVLCDCDLPEGKWRSLLEIAANCPRPSRFIVFSRHADVSLWAEALNLGAYDLLVFPFDSQELTRVVGLATDSWVREGQYSSPGAPQACENAASNRKSVTPHSKLDVFLRKAAGL
jgi:DNA-binding NtrC family response regulator